MRGLFLVPIYLAGSLSTGGAFAPNCVVRPALAAARQPRLGSATRSHTSALSARSRRSKGREGHKEKADGFLHKEMKTLLTERSIDNVIYYMKEFHDDLTPKWLEEQLGIEDKREKYGGDTFGQGTTWAIFMLELMRTEPEELIVKRIAQKPRGGSGNNPFLDNSPSYHEYKQVINPQNIAQRIFQSRTLIAEEVARDLQLMDLGHEELWRMHELISSEKEGGNGKGMSTDEIDRERHLVFDLSSGGDSSPFRHRNLHMFMEMATNYAMERYEAELREQGDIFTCNWLERFMAKNRRDLEKQKTEVAKEAKGLTGDALIEKMMTYPSVVVNSRMVTQNGWNGRAVAKAGRRGVTERLVEPAQMARQLMAIRSKVGRDMQAFLKDTQKDHDAIDRKMMEWTFERSVALAELQSQGEVAVMEEKGQEEEEVEQEQEVEVVKAVKRRRGKGGRRRRKKRHIDAVEPSVKEDQDGPLGKEFEI